MDWYVNHVCLRLARLILAHDGLWWDSTYNVCAMKMWIPMIFTDDKVKFGELFNSSTVDLVVYYPEHERNYLELTLALSNRGYIFFSINDFDQGLITFGSIKTGQEEQF